MIRRNNITYKEKSLIIPLYKAIVRPHLEYCIQAWNPYLRKYIDNSRRSRIFLRRGPALVSSAMSTRFSGGGVVAEIFRGLQKPVRFGGGGEYRRIFRFRHLTAAFFVNGALLHFFTFPKGGPGPPGPPLNRPLDKLEKNIEESN